MPAKKRTTKKKSTKKKKGATPTNKLKLNASLRFILLRMQMVGLLENIKNAEVGTDNGET